MKLFGHRGDVQCRRAVELITDYLEDARPPAQRRRLDKHLAGYPHCAEYLAQIRATITAIGIAGPGDLDPASRRDLITLYRKTIR
jgi:anti-sigma factor RsiW